MKTNAVATDAIATHALAKDATGGNSGKTDAALKNAQAQAITVAVVAIAVTKFDTEQKMEHLT